MQRVAPFVGAWIEIIKNTRYKASEAVAPFVGAWIEIQNSHRVHNRTPVAPFVGAWIEIVGDSLTSKITKRRSLRGSVD